MSEIADKIKRIVADHLGVDEAKVVPQASFIDDLGADSLDTVELVMVFEEELASKFPSMWLKKSPPSGTRSTTSKRRSRIGVLATTELICRMRRSVAFLWPMRPRQLYCCPPIRSYAQWRQVYWGL